VLNGFEFRLDTKRITYSNRYLDDQRLHRSGAIAGRLPSSLLATEFQAETLRAIASIGFRDDFLLGMDWAIAERAPPNI
jgi:hypothetical protein